MNLKQMNNAVNAIARSSIIGSPWRLATHLPGQALSFEPAAVRYRFKGFIVLS
jgi:hypothetical protein